ncbi:hypothetical protein LOD99_4378 [Oopsacas minuta]|uniref:Kazal-like domain-containing protein n=1 Tax=Oopsacas minuta TaxID=111878 RepID=A0AAV7JUG5_9METZ|nr:hypothetical protein LOD99_4378 [Oopsacas minuta]
MVTRITYISFLTICFFIGSLHSQCTSDSACASGQFCRKTCSVSRPELTVTALLSEPITDLSGTTFFPLSYPLYEPLMSITTPFTVSVAFRASPGSRGYLFFLGKDPDARALAIHIHDMGYIWVYTALDDQTYELNQFKPNFPINDGNRYCLLLKVESNELTLYINGINNAVLTATAPSGRSFDITSNLTSLSGVQPSFLIGARMFGNYRFSGNIYHIFVYHGALDNTDAESICRLESDRSGSCQPYLTIGETCPAPYSPRLEKGPCTNDLDLCDIGLSCYPNGPDATWSCQPTASHMCQDYTDCLAGSEFCYGPLPDDGSSVIPDPSLNLIGMGHNYVDTLHDFTQSHLTFLTIPATDHPALTPDITLFGVFNQVPDNDAYLIAKGHDVIMRDFGLYLRGSEDFTWLVYSNTGGNYTTQVFFHESPIDDGVYHTIAATIDTDTMRAALYVDGDLLEYQMLEGIPLFSDISNELWIGGRPRTSNYMFNGSISYVSVFDYALSGPQIRYLSDSFLLPNLTVSEHGVASFCLPKPARNEKCYTNLADDRNFSCQKGLVCIPGAEFPNIPYPMPVTNVNHTITSPVGYCAVQDCVCNDPLNKVCGSNGQTYDNDCLRDCYGPPFLQGHIGECIDYEDILTTL